jgi:hypothetical protein
MSKTPLTQVYYGEVGNEAEPSTDDWEDPDDDELEETPPDVVELLGLDPKDLEDDDEEEEDEKK